MSEPHSIRILEPRIPNHVVCPYCGLRQLFVKETEYWRTVKAPNLKHPLVLKIRMVCAKCGNPGCPHMSFCSSHPGDRTLSTGYPDPHFRNRGRSRPRQ